MNKVFTVLLAITVLAFLTTNAILMFGEKSILSKRVYVHEYERAYANTYTEKMAKEALTAPAGELTIYAPDGAVDQWLVREGDTVEPGTELALLDGRNIEEQQAIWEAEQDALEDERREVQSSLRDLEAARSRSDSSSRSSESRSSNPSGTDTQLNVDVEVEVPQEGAYAAGIAQAEQRLAAIDRELAIVDAQLDQNGANPALLSPYEGTVASVNTDAEPHSVTLYPAEKLFRTFVLEEEWPEVNEGDRALIQTDGEGAVPAFVTRVSTVPAGSSKWLEAYKALQPEEQPNPLAFYEVELTAEDPVGSLPYGSMANAEIILNEAEDAVALHESYIYSRTDGEAKTHLLTPEGFAQETPVMINFDLHNKAVLSEGVEPGAVVLKEDSLRHYLSPPAVFMPFPLERPNWYQAKNINWREYVEYMLAR